MAGLRCGPLDLRGGYGHSANLRLSDFVSDRTLMATHHNGEPLTAEHGSPMRLVVPHLYGYKGPKWLRGIEYLTRDRRGFPRRVRRSGTALVVSLFLLRGRPHDDE